MPTVYFVTNALPANQLVGKSSVFNQEKIRICFGPRLEFGDIDKDSTKLEFGNQNALQILFLPCF